MKYILHPDTGLLLFEHHIRHDEWTKEEFLRKFLEKAPIGAAFVRQANAGLECYGESLSLNLKASDRDTQRLNAFLREAK